MQKRKLYHPDDVYPEKIPNWMRETMHRYNWSTKKWSIVTIKNKLTCTRCLQINAIYFDKSGAINPKCFKLKRCFKCADLTVHELTRDPCKQSTFFHNDNLPSNLTFT